MVENHIFFPEKAEDERSSSASDHHAIFRCK